MTHPLFREDKIITSLIKLNYLYWNDKDTIPFLEDADGCPISADEYNYTNIEPVIELTLNDSGEKYVCDGILFFGDGTIEFHNKQTQEAINWEYFDEKSLVKIENHLDILLKNKG